MSCDVTQIQLTDYVKGELDRRVAEQIANHLPNCPTCRDAQAEIQKNFGLLHLLPAESPTPDVWSRIEASLDQEDATERPVRPISPAARLLIATISLAAAALLALTLGRLSNPVAQPAPANLARIERIGDGVTMSRVADGSRSTLGPGAVVRAGETIEMDPGAAAIFRIDGVGRFRVAGGSKLRLIGKGQIVLEQGEVLADVEPGGRGFEIATPVATAHVTGTLFRVLADESRAALTVARGSVEFSNNLGRRTVKAGCHATAVAGSAPQDPVVLDAAAADWDLFQSVAPHPRVALAIEPGTNPGSLRFTVSLSAELPTKVDSLLSDRAYLILTLTDPGGAVVTRRLSAADVRTQLAGKAARGVVEIEPGRTLSFTATLADLKAAPGRWTASAHFASAGESEAWAGFAESDPVSFQTTR
jgi:hypothetical protein